MSRWKYVVACVVGAAVGLLSTQAGFSQDAASGPPVKKEARDSGKGPGLRADRPAGEGPGRWAKPAREGEFDRPPGKPRWEGDFQGPPPKAAREGDFEGPPDKGPRDVEFGAWPPGPPRDPDRIGPPLGREGRPGPEHRPPLGPPRWPHEDWQSMEKNDPEMFKLLSEDIELDRHTREQAMQYRRAPKEQRQQIKQRIEELVSKHFDVRQQRRSLELKRLEEELKRLREAMDRREKARKEIVEKRVSELLGPEDGADF